MPLRGNVRDALRVAVFPVEGYKGDVHYLLLPLYLANGSAPGPEDLYARVVTRAYEHAQSQLLSKVSFVVNHSKWEDPWVVTTEHYEVRTTSSYRFAAETGRSLEFMYEEFSKLLGTGQATSGKFPVWIFPTLSDYNAFGQQNGAEHSSMLGSFYSVQHPERPVVTYWIPNRTLLGMWITHSAVHQYLEQTFGEQSTVWVAEGLAGFFSLYWDWPYGARELERMKASKAYLPLEHLVRDPLPAYLTNPNERFIELGMLFRFLLNYYEPTKSEEGNASLSPFQAFLRLAVRGQDVSRTEFAQIFSEGASKLDEDFKRFEFPR